jgi:translation elongation factor EF-Tu-like GTPase
MIKVLAQIRLYSGVGKRRTAFASGYRPLFDVRENTKTSGQITLLDRDKLAPGDSACVEIKFINAECVKGTKFYFYESREPLGEGEVIEILEVS